jgi:dolichol-phosphate mannosyltransferase
LTNNDERTESGRSLVILPTFNELANVESIIQRTLAAVADADVLVIDDNSPDGTGALVERLAASDHRVFVHHRTGKLGLGSAYVHGFTWGLQRGYDLLVEMDADGSHPPESLPAMIELARDGSVDAPGLVIGSRWVTGGQVVNWPRRRQLLSRAGNTYVQWMLGLSVKDATAGFRVYTADTLRAVDWTTVDSKGYCFQVDMTLRVVDLGARVIEHPIVFTERVAGESKMSRGIVLEAMARVTVWGLRRKATRLARLLKVGRGH